MVQTILPVQYIDFIVQPGSSFTHSIPEEMETVVVYVYTGAGEFTDKRVQGSDGETLLLGVGHRRPTPHSAAWTRMYFDLAAAAGAALLCPNLMACAAPTIN